jgi:hypothetical protein
VPGKVTFTGSVEGGRSVNLAGAADLKRVTLELGGNDPAILLDDVDVAAIAEGLFWTGFFNTARHAPSSSASTCRSASTARSSRPSPTSPAG